MGEEKAMPDVHVTVRSFSVIAEVTGEEKATPDFHLTASPLVLGHCSGHGREGNLCRHSCNSSLVLADCSNHGRGESHARF